MTWLYLSIFSCIFFHSPAYDHSTILKVQVEIPKKFKSPQVYLAVFTNANDFPDHPERSAQQVSAIATNGRVELELHVNDAKSCAIACFVDLNNNGKLDTNWFGIPKEPYSFSGVNKWYKKPSWKHSQIMLNGTLVTCTLNVE